MEPTTVLSIVSTALGLLNLVKTSIAALYADVIDWREYTVWNETRRDRLKSVSTLLLKWHRRWMIWTDDTTLVRTFWNEDGAKTVLRHLKLVQEAIALLDKLLKACELSGLNAVERGLKKLGHVAIKFGTRLDKQMALVDTRMGLLNTASDHHFLEIKDRRDPANPDAPLETLRIHNLGHSQQLVDLAWDTFQTANELYGCCVRRPITLDMQLELNVFGQDIKRTDRISPDKLAAAGSDVTSWIEREEAIARSVADGAVRYTFLVRDPQQSEAWVRIRVTADDALNPATCKTTVLNAIRAVRERNGPEYFGLELNNNSAKVLVREEFGKIRGSIPEPQPLRVMLGRLDDRMSETVRIKLALDLTQFGLLFFKTDWIHTLDRCNVHGVRITSSDADERDEELYKFALKRLDPDHPKDKPDHPTDPPCWCAIRHGTYEYVPVAMEDYPLFFLGLMLVELILGTPMVEVRLAGRVAWVNGITLTYVDEGTAHRPLTSQTIQQLERTLNGRGEGFYKAIKFCVESTWTTETVPRDKMRQDYYFDVICPFHKVYNDLRNRHRARH